MSRNVEPAETKRLREFHTLGKQVLEADKGSDPLAGGKRRRGVAKQFQNKQGLKRDQVDKARQFASMYSEQELNELCSLNTEDRTKRLTKSHVIRLLAVRNKRSRMKLAKQVVQDGWSVQRLGQEITKSGKTSQGGRRPKRPATVDEAKHQIKSMVQQWVKWMEMMDDSDGDQDVGIEDLPKSVVRTLARMTKSAEMVKATVSRERS